jgi:Ca2+-binding EF-hand superfamily protein
MSLFFALDRDHSGGVSFVEILRALFPDARRLMLLDMVMFVAEHDAKQGQEKRAGRPPSKAELAEYSAMFKMYDVDGNGTLTVGELREAMTGTEMEPEEIAAMFDSANVDGDSSLDLQEFIALMSGVMI